jgi:hypothetical protein
MSRAAAAVCRRRAPFFLEDLGPPAFGKVRSGADKVAVAGREDTFTVPVLFELGSGGLIDRCHHSPGKDSAPGIIDKPLPSFRLKPGPQLFNAHF